MQRFEQLTVSNTVKQLTAAIFQPQTYMKARKAMITVDDAAIRFTTDGSTPTTLIGHSSGSGDVISLESADEIRHFKAIRSTGTDAIINVTYSYGE